MFVFECGSNIPVFSPAILFVIEGPRFAAFYARRWGGRSYPEGALFTLRVVEGENLVQASQLRVFHGFGDPAIVWQGTTYDVRREQTIPRSP